MSDIANESPPISRIWALACAVLCMIFAICFDRFILSGHSKAVAFGAFMSAFCLKVSWPWISKSRVILLLMAFAALQVVIGFVLPRDSAYPGAFLVPLAILDFFTFYFLLKRVTRRAAK